MYFGPTIYIKYGERDSTRGTKECVKACVVLIHARLCAYLIIVSYTNIKHNKIILSSES